jgi:hypothetical protein
MRLIAIGLGFLWGLTAVAEPTELHVRVLAQDAKFVGTGMGGMNVTVRAVQDNTVLAEGVIRGGTGDTELIMSTPRARGASVVTDKAAVFTTTIDIVEPTLVEVSVQGPLDYPHASQRISLSHWLVPGRHLTGGNGLMLTLPGFVVTGRIAAEQLSLATADSVQIGATVTMMCGCPLTPGGLWDSDRFDIGALIYSGGELIDEVMLEYAGKPNEFGREWNIPAAGEYHIAFFAHDPANGNTGVDQAGLEVTR